MASSSSNHGQNSWSGGTGSGGSGSRHHRSSGRRSGGGGGRSSNSHRQQQQQQQQQAYYNSLPLEQGVICSLKESFGFIHCADRPDELFFHYSQLMSSSTGNNSNNNNISSEDLEMDMEVEFRVGTSFNNNSNNNNTKKKKDDKLAAFCVRPLPPGTIVWETVEQEHVTGIVENRVVTPRRQDGRIRVLEETITTDNDDEDDNDQEHRQEEEEEQQQQQQQEVQPKVAAANKEDETTTTTIPAAKKTPTARATGPLVKFGPNDYNAETTKTATAVAGGGGHSSNSNNFNDKPPPPLRLAKGDLVAFTLVRDRRTQELWARNIHLLLSERERARQEAEARLLAEASLEHGVITALKGEYGFLRSNKRREEVYFHYSDIHLDDDDDDDDNNNHHHHDDEVHRETAEHSNNEPNDKRPTNNEMVLREGQDMQFLVVTEGGDAGRFPQVRLSARRVKMRPRGSVKFHDVVATGMAGLVSIVPQPQDSGHALDTKGKVLLAMPLKDVDDKGNEKVVAEVYLSSKDSPGGSFAFRGGSSVGLWIEVGDTLLFDVVRDYADGAFRAVPTRHQIPSEDPTDISMADDEEEEEDKKESVNDRRIRLINLSLAHRAEGIVNAVKDAYGFVHFAERPVDAHFKLFQLLPDEIQKDLRRNMGLADVDDKGNPLQLEVGAEVQFDLSVHGSIQSHSTRHRGRQASHPHERENLKAQRVLLLPPNTIRHIFPLAQGIRGCVTKDNPKQPYSGSIDLDEAVKAMTPEERHPLVAKMIDDFMARKQDLPLVYHDVQSLKEDDTVIDMIERHGEGKLSWIHIPQPGESHYPGRLCIRKDPSKIEKLKDRETRSDEGLDIEIEVSDDAHETVSDDGGGGGGGGKRGHRHRKLKDTRTVKSVRFDKSNLCKELKDDMPPGVGDIVEFDLSQSRRTGQCIVENMRIVTRKEPKLEDAEESLSFGVVKDVVAARKFGFISVIDETAQNLEMLFFSLSNVISPPPESEDGTPPKKKPQIRKGDEVKFNIGTERGGKRVALDVTVLPKGTIPSTADKNACTGFILMEPSHTTLKKVTLRQTKSNISQTSGISQSSVQSSERSGRWGSVDEDRIRSADEDQLAEDGCILLLEDPTGIFNSKKNGSESGESVPESELEESSKTFLHRHLNYKNGAIAVHGTGSSSATDEKTRPRRGDKVSFTKTKKGGDTVRDIRIVERDAATLLRGRLEGISDDSGGGCFRFIAATAGEEVYKVSHTEVVSCDPTMLKEKEPVEGILYDGSIYGICRAADLYLETKLATKRKERPKLNLTVKKDRGGTIMAQSMMAKGPDEGTHGFAPGWTKRMSAYAKPFTPESAGK